MTPITAAIAMQRGDAGDQHQPAHLGHHARGRGIEWLVVVRRRVAHGFDAGAQRDIGGGRRGGGRTARPRAGCARRRTVALAPQGADPGGSRRDRRRHDPRSRPPRQRRRHASRSTCRPPQDAEIAAENIPLDGRVRGRRAHRDRQAGRAGRPSRRRQLVRHAGQRAHRPLRRQPLRHRRREAPRHRASPRQGHQRPDGGGQDRPRPSRAQPPVRRPRPHRPAAARLSGFRLGRAGPATRHHRQADRPPSRTRATRWRCARAAARRSPTGRCSSAIPAQTARRWRACSPAGWRPGARTRSGSISPRSAIPCSATTSTVQASRPRPINSAPDAQAALEDPWQTGLACLSTGDRTSIGRQGSGVPLGTAGRSLSFTP